MNLYIVGGFLGSGKTTAIVEASRILTGQHQIVGIVTNDQGRYLVDTAFFRAEGIPAVEVTGGCFCCHYDDLDEVLSGLISKRAPDTVFAESVGSCADIISTVLKPLAKYRPKEITHSVLTVFSDIRFFQAKMKGDDLPFSEEVNYIYAEQIEEAGILILNKKDLIGNIERETLLKEAKKKYPGKIVLLQNSYERTDIGHWLDCLFEYQAVTPLQGLNLDYDRYAQGEAQLAWLDARVHFRSKESVAWTEILNSFLETLIRNVRGQSRIAHLKCQLNCSEQYQKISITSFQENWRAQLTETFIGKELSILLNLRAETHPEILKKQLRDTLKAIILPGSIEMDMEFENAFAPAKPNPTHRIS